MRIGLDATPLTVPTGGVRRYVSELSAALERSFPEDSVALLSDQFTRPEGVLNRRWWLWGLHRELVRQRIEVFHGTDFSVPYLPLHPAVLTIHDLSPWRNPGWHHDADRVRTRTPWLLRLRLATLVLTPSQAIRAEVIERFRVPPDRVTAVPHAASRLFRPCPESDARPPYLLYVGTLEPRKNIALLLEVWRKIRETHPVDLVLAGRARADAPEIRPEAGLRVLGAVPDADLPRLYSNCMVCLYPSHYEGFGLPVLEAMQCGAPVVTSDDPAILETAGDAAITLPPNEPSRWMEAISAILEKPECRAGLKRRSLARAAQFSWDKTACATREVYAEAIRRFHGQAGGLRGRHRPGARPTQNVYAAKN